MLLFTPTYVAIANYRSGGSARNSDVPTKITIKVPSGQSWTVAADEDSSIISTFLNMNKSENKVQSLPESISGGAFTLVTFDYGSKTAERKYYFSTNSSECYFTDEFGDSYRIQSSYAAQFLNTQYASFLYKSSTLPSLTVNGLVLDAAVINWSYKTENGSFKSTSSTNTDNAQFDAANGDGINIAFDVAPTNSKLLVKSGDTIWYEGDYASVPSLSLDRNTDLSFTLDASWQNDSYVGNATYSFTLSVTAPPRFLLGSAEVSHGDVVVLSGLNVKDTGKIRFSSEPTINFTPAFYRDGDYVHALIPLGCDLKTGKYKFTVAYGDTVSELELTVNAPRYKFDSRTSNVSADIVNKLYTSANLSAYYSVLTGIGTQTSVATGSTTTKFTRLWFKNNNELTSNKNLKMGFGKIVTLANSSSKASYTHTGLDFAVEDGTSVPSVGDGVVCAVGSDNLLGNYVVVDHGFGLRSWYAHLGEISVKSGDKVIASQTIGKSGSTGFTESGRLHFGFTVGTTAVSPYSLFDSGLVFPKF